MIKSLIVRRKPGKNSHLGIMKAGNTRIACSLGRSGITALKREGDGATPIGSFAILKLLYRKDRVHRSNWQLASNPVHRNDGWCDAPSDRNYNRPVDLPYPGRTESMHRADQLYDLCIILDYNISKRSRNAGSAIFFHLQNTNGEPTEGCVAISRIAMLRLLREITPQTRIRIIG